MTETGGEKGSRSIRALEVIEAIVSSGRAMGIGEIMSATGLPKATVHRLCGLLEAEGFLAPDMGGKGLSLGHRANEMALGIMSLGGGNAYRHHILSELSREIGETCNLNVPVGSRMLYIDRVETEWPMRMQLPVGSRVPLHCTASGKLFLSLQPSAKRRRLLDSLPMEALTPNTITDRAVLETALEEIRRNRVGTDDGEFVEGMVAAAVPIIDGRGRIAGTLAFHAPVIRMDMEKAKSHVPALKRAAEALSADLKSDD